MKWPERVHSLKSLADDIRLAVTAVDMSWFEAKGDGSKEKAFLMEAGTRLEDCLIRLKDLLK